MKRIKFLLFCVIFFLCSPLIAQVAEPAGRAAIIEAIRLQLLPVLKKNKVPGAAIVIYDHGHPYAFYYGVASYIPKVPVNGDTDFEIASISKVFTSVLLAEESEKGIVAMDDPMTKYIKFLPKTNPNFSKVSLEDLASHVNGFGNMPGAKVYNREQLLKSLKMWKPYYQPGTWWSYSNIGFGLLGYALVDASHMNFMALLNFDIFNPLEMRDAQLVGMTCGKAHTCAKGHSWDGTPIKTTKKLLIIPAAGSIEASGNDMLKFMAAAMNFPGTPPNVAEAIRITETPVYQTKYGAQALGWEAHDIHQINKYGHLKKFPKYITLRSSPVKEIDIQLPYDDLMFDKTGSVAGFRSYMVIVPGQQTGITVMVNKAMSRTSLVTATRRALLMILQA